jgi:hypothetical protein
MIPIAHRGLWTPDHAAQNSLAAIAAATRAGYGLELDVRLGVGGRLWLQHAAADTPWLLDGANADWTLVLDALRAAPVILWDIKELRAVQPLCQWLVGRDLSGSALLFDLEIAEPAGTWRADAWANVPDHRPAYLRRASETESLYDALGDEHAAGVWLDAWEREWVDAGTIQTVQAAGKKAFVCSSELHRRPISLRLWRAWAGADGVCTNYPHLLAGLDRPELQPAGWHAEVHR